MYLVFNTFLKEEAKCKVQTQNIFMRAVFPQTPGDKPLKRKSEQRNYSLRVNRETIA